MKFNYIPDNLEVGELYVDTTDKAIYTKDSNDDIIKVSVGTFTDAGGETFNDYDSNKAKGLYSHAEGHGTEANNVGEHAEGTFNISRVGSNSTISTIGVGSGDDDRINAAEVHTDGSVFIKDVGGFDGKSLSDSKSLQEVIKDLQDNTGGLSPEDRETLDKVPGLETDVEHINNKIGDLSPNPQLSITQRLNGLEFMIKSALTDIKPNEGSPITAKILNGVATLGLNVDDQSFIVSEGKLFVNHIDNGEISDK